MENDRDQVIKTMVKQGHTEKEIADALHLSQSYVHKMKRELGLTVRRRYTKNDVKNIVELFKQGHTREEIADKLGWCKETVSTILRKNGFGRMMVACDRKSVPVVVPAKRVIKPEMVIDKSTGKVYYDISELFLETEGRSIWNT